MMIKISFFFLANILFALPTLFSQEEINTGKIALASFARSLQVTCITENSYASFLRSLSKEEANDLYLEHRSPLSEACSIQQEVISGESFFVVTPGQEKEEVPFLSFSESTSYANWYSEKQAGSTPIIVVPYQKMGDIFLELDADLKSSVLYFSLISKKNVPSPFYSKKDLLFPLIFIPIIVYNGFHLLNKRYYTGNTADLGDRERNASSIRRNEKEDNESLSNEFERFDETYTSNYRVLDGSSTISPLTSSDYASLSTSFTSNNSMTSFENQNFQSDNE